MKRDLGPVLLAVMLANAVVAMAVLKMCRGDERPWCQEGAGQVQEAWMRCTHGGRVEVVDRETAVCRCPGDAGP